MAKLLYTAPEWKATFCTKIAYRVDGFGPVFCQGVTEESMPGALEGIEGVVFIGPQTSKQSNGVFRDRQSYWLFVEAAHEHDLGIAAVLPDRYCLPGRNRGIDEVIYPIVSRASIEYAALRISDFFISRHNS
ncbi:MAG: hypothetical protein ABH879_10435 [archaeon]